MRLESAWIASAIGSGRWIQSASGPSTRRPSTRTGWPGLPTTVEFGGHVGDHDAVGADLRAVADRDRAEQLRARADRDVVLHGRVALAGGEAGAAERDALVERHVVADLGRLADHHAGAVVDEQPLADSRGGVDLDAGERAREHRDQRAAAAARRPGAARARPGRRAARGCRARWRGSRPARPRARPDRGRARRARRGGPPWRPARTRRTRAWQQRSGRPGECRATVLARRARRAPSATARRTPARRSARRSRASSRRSACPRTPGGRRPAARPTAPLRRRSRRAARRVGRSSRRSGSRPRRRPAMTSSSSSRLSTGGTKPAPMPWMRCGPGGPPESTAEPRGSTATTRRRGLTCSRRYSPTPVIVPPVPTPATSTSTRPSSARSISGPVVRRWASGLAGLENWSGRNTSALARHRARGRDRLAHAAERLGDVHARAVQPQQALALAAHPLRQREHQLVALGGAHERERDARVAAGGLDDRRAPRLDPALPPRRPRSSRRRCGP